MDNPSYPNTTSHMESISPGQLFPPALYPVVALSQLDMHMEMIKEATEGALGSADAQSSSTPIASHGVCSVFQGLRCAKPRIRLC